MEIKAVTESTGKEEMRVMIDVDAIPGSMEASIQKPFHRLLFVTAA